MPTAVVPALRIQIDHDWNIFDFVDVLGAIDAIHWLCAMRTPDELFRLERFAEDNERQQPRPLTFERIRTLEHLYTARRGLPRIDSLEVDHMKFGSAGEIVVLISVVAVPALAASVVPLARAARLAVKTGLELAHGVQSLRQADDLHREKLKDLAEERQRKQQKFDDRRRQQEEAHALSLPKKAEDPGAIEYFAPGPQPPFQNPDVALNAKWLLEHTVLFEFQRVTGAEPERIHADLMFLVKHLADIQLRVRIGQIQSIDIIETKSKDKPPPDLGEPPPSK